MNYFTSPNPCARLPCRLLTFTKTPPMPALVMTMRYKGVLYMKGTERKVVFQGVHQLMGSDLGPAWAAGEKKGSKMVFIGLDLPKDILLQGLEQCLA